MATSASSRVIKYHCPFCLGSISVTPGNKYRKHDGAEKGVECILSRQLVPVRIQIDGPVRDPGDDRPIIGVDYDVCPGCDRKPKLDEHRAFRDHVTQQGGSEKCMFSGKDKEGKKPAPPIAVEPAPKKCIGHNRGCDCFVSRIACPNPECGTTVGIYDNGCIGPHMAKNWGEAVCPMSGQNVGTDAAAPTGMTTLDASIATSSIQPSQVLKSTDVPSKPPPKAEPKRIETLSLESVRIPESTAKDIVPPAPADVPAYYVDTRADNPPEIIEYERRADDVPPIENLEMVGHSCNFENGSPELGGHSIDCQLTLREKIAKDCPYCGEVLGGRHECYPRFVAAGSTCEPDSCVSSGHVADSYCDFHQHAESPFVAAGDIPKALEPVPMDIMAERLVAQLKEMFYAYSNRMERSVQETLGPSEVGTPCDRRLAMSLLNIPPVNPGGDNWASFVGTCVHTGLAEMLQWADANQGRFAVEVPLEFPSKLVPKGTSDLLDRVLLMAIDHKAMGRFSLDKLRIEGIKPLYLVQLMIYAYGQILKGEKVKYVAVVSWPREQATLKDLYAVVVPYDKSIAEEAFARVERINSNVSIGRAVGYTPLENARTFDIQDDCTYCPFYAKGDPEMTRGCNGRN